MQEDICTTLPNIKKRKGKLQISQKTQFTIAILLRSTTSSQDSLEKINHTGHNLSLKYLTNKYFSSSSHFFPF